MGGKYDLLPQIMPYIPSDISVFVDLFGGGFNIGANVEAEKILYNDHVTPLVKLFKCFYNKTSEEIIEYIETTIEENNLSKQDKESYYQFRDKYNESNYKNPLDLYILQCFSFNNIIRFNKKRMFNASHGTNRSHFTIPMRNKLIRFVNLIHEKNIIFTDNDFTFLKVYKLPENSFVYLDPPYYISEGVYNKGDKYAKPWGLEEEKSLYSLLDYLNDNRVKFMLQNVVTHDGKQNYILQDYINNNDFNVVDVDSDYSNCNYRKKTAKNMRNTHEVLVMNY